MAKPAPEAPKRSIAEHLKEAALILFVVMPAIGALLLGASILGILAVRWVESLGR